MATAAKKRWVAAISTLLIGAILYLALPFALSPVLARCYPSRAAQAVIRNGYPFLHMRSDNPYKNYWLKRLNEQIKHADSTCRDRNTRIDAL